MNVIQFSNYSKYKISGVIVLFNQDSKIVNNILSYIYFLENLFIVDNSPNNNGVLFSEFKDFNILYTWDGQNRGLAWALNFGADLAVKSGCNWLLTMDQDSYFLETTFKNMFSGIDYLKAPAIISPTYQLVGTTKSEASNTKIGGAYELGGFIPIKLSMTSGNLLNLDAYLKSGPFLEKLFIDYVDYEYCLRLIKNNYNIYRSETSILIHRLGSIKKASLFGVEFNPTHHSAIRKYYITRNRLFVIKTYPEIIFPEIYAWVKEVIKMLLFEENRFLKMKYMLNGFFHFLVNKYGKLSEN